MGKYGNNGSVIRVHFPEYDKQFLKDDSYEYPISVNGKMRTKIKFATDIPIEDIEKQVLVNEVIQKWTDGKPPKKVIVVPNRIVNIANKETAIFSCCCHSKC